MNSGRKPLEAIWTRLAIDPVADRLAGLLVRYPTVTPNRVTLVAGLLAVGSAAAFLGEHFLLGGLLFQLRFLVDCVDGRLARIRGAGTRWGAALDVFVDTAGVLLCFAALGTALVARDSAGPLVLSLVLLGCGLYAWTLAYRKSLPGGGPKDWLATAETESEMSDGRSAEGSAEPAVEPSTGQSEPRSGLRALPGRWVRAQARRGMVPTPYAVELELLSLTLLPLTGWAPACVAGLWIAVAFYAAATSLNVVRIRRLTVPADVREAS